MLQQNMPRLQSKWWTTAELAQVYKRNEIPPEQKVQFRNLLVSYIIRDIGGTHDKNAFEKGLKDIGFTSKDDPDAWSQLHNAFHFNVKQEKIIDPFMSAANLAAKKKNGKKRARRERGQPAQKMDTEMVANADCAIGLPREQEGSGYPILC